MFSFLLPVIIGNAILRPKIRPNVSICGNDDKVVGCFYVIDIIPIFLLRLVQNVRIVDDRIGSRQIFFR